MSNKLKRTLLIMSLSGALFAPNASAVVITQWNFNGPSAATVPLDVNGMPTPAIGNGTALLIGGTTGGFSSGTAQGGSTDPVTTTPNNYGWQTTNYASPGTGNETAGVQFMVSTVGYNNITFGYDQRASNTSSRFWAVNYTIDGSTWLRLSLDNMNSNPGSGSYGTAGTFASTSGDTWFNGRTIDFSNVMGVSNNANFGIRILASFGAGTNYAAAGSTYAGTGTARFDMVTFNGLSTAAKNLVWNLTTGGAWDTATANWTGDGTIYADGDNVTFNKVEGGTINITGTRAPTLVTVSAASGTYTLNSATAGDKISGAGSLVKSGGGILVIAGDNEYTGNTTLSGGTLRIDSSASPLGTPLGSSTVAIDGGTLENTAAIPATIVNAVTIGSNGGTINTGSQNLTINSMPNLAGLMTKTGAGNLILTSNFNPGPGGGINIAAGNFVLNQPGYIDPGQTGTIVNVAGNSTLAGNLVISNPIRFNVNGSATVSGTGEIQIVQSNSLISQASGNQGGTIAVPIKLNATNVTAGAIGTWSGTDYTSSDFRITIGGTSGGGLTLNAPISGNSEVDLSNNRDEGGGTGFLQLNAVSTYTGNTTINANTPAVQPYSVRLGVNNALPATGLIAGTKTGIGLAVLDLNGFNQQLGYLADGGNVIPGSKSLTITNHGAVDSILSIGGSITPGDSSFSGIVADGMTNKIAVVKNGANTQVITGDNTYTGGTTISSGTLQVGIVGGTTGALGTGSIQNAATLNVARSGLAVGKITGTGTTNVTAASATLTASSIRQSVLSIGATSTATVAPSLGNKSAGISVFTNTTGASLSIAAGGNFDTNDNDLIVYYQPGQGAATLATIQQQIIDGFLNTPAVAKISSSTGAVDGDKFLVAIDNGAIGLTDWEGVTLTGSNQIIAKYTLFGDLNLDGAVDSFDYSVIDSNFGTGNSWLSGDSNLDGVVNSFDYSTVDTNFGKSFPSMGGGAANLSIAAVPEPSTFVLGGLGLLGLAGLKLRRKKA